MLAVKQLSTWLLIFVITIMSAKLYSHDNRTAIRGCNKTFAHKTVTVTTLDDPITETQKILFSGVADSNGCFAMHIDIQRVMLLEVTFGKYIGRLYAEPGRNYDLALPDYEPKSIVDSLNPFFEPIGFYFRIKNLGQPELTDAIADFDRIYDHFLAQYFSQISQHRYYSQIDTLKPFIDSLFSDVENSYFIDYKNLSIAYLYALTLVKNHKAVIKENFLGKPVLYNNTAYFMLFNELFKDYLPYYADTKQGKRLAADIAKAKSYTFAMETLGNNPLLRDTVFRELVLIKSINDALTAGQLPISSSFQTLDSIKILTRVEEHRKIIENIKQKSLILAKGTRPPGFELKESGGNNVQLSDLQGKYVYLNFVNIKSFTAEAELQALNYLHKKYIEHLRVVTIATGSGNMPAMTKLFRDKKYEWQLLDGTNSDNLMSDYKVIASPTCYLLSPELKLLLTPAPPPNDHFEFYLIKIMRDDRIQKIRTSGEQRQPDNTRNQKQTASDTHP